MVHNNFITCLFVIWGGEAKYQITEIFLFEKNLRSIFEDVVVERHLLKDATSYFISPKDYRFSWAISQNHR